MPEDPQITDYALDAQTHVVQAEGQIDLYSAPELKEGVWRVIDAGKTRVIVDLTGVTFIDSTGLGVLIGALKRVRARRGTLALVVTDYDIERLFELTGLDGTFSIHRSRDDALEHLEHAQPS